MKLRSYIIHRNPVMQFIGLRFSKRNNNLLILDLQRESKLGSAIDTIFVFYPISVIWLDKNKKVVDIRNNIKPFSFCVIPRKKARYIVESTKPFYIKIGNTVSF